MRFLVDADSPRLSIEILKKHSHDAVHVRDVLLPSAADGRILEHARKTERIVVSKDLGFAHDLIKDWSFPTSRWLDTIA
ncbi:MAG: DUF5615 family PIN-like protein [Chloroflexi bacterium]|nr:DUF5615 family PIN-like protein [Chloroflexota bacterium]